MDNITSTAQAATAPLGTRVRTEDGTILRNEQTGWMPEYGFDQPHPNHTVRGTIIKPLSFYSN